MSFHISPSPRVRRSPFFNSTVADGVVSFSPYNRMLMPTGYGDPLAEYWRLINTVSMWDVSVERQVELKGPDAARLAQILTPRKLDRMEAGVGWYVALCDHRGVLINDPILLKHSDDHFWLSIADGDVLLWARAIAAERGLDVEVTEPDVSPMAIQGPKAEDVVAALLGESIREIRHFRFRPMMLDNIPLVVARSGWSRQGGFELYLTDGRYGDELWEKVKEAGQPYGIGPGNPNPMERIESGLLSWGGDTDDQTNPFEVRMERYIQLDAPDDVVGIQALRKIHAEGPVRHQMGIVSDTVTAPDYSDVSGAVLLDGEEVGRVTAQSWSPRLEKSVGLCLIKRSVKADATVNIVYPDREPAEATVVDLPFV